MVQIVLLRPHFASLHARTMAEFVSVCLCYDKTVNKWNYCLRRQYNQCPTLIIIIYNIMEHVFFHAIPSGGQLWDRSLSSTYQHSIHMVCPIIITIIRAIIARFMKQNNGKRNQLNRWSIDLRWIYMAALRACVSLSEQHRSHQKWSDCNRCHYNHRQHHSKVSAKLKFVQVQPAGNFHRKLWDERVENKRMKKRERAREWRM